MYFPPDSIKLLRYLCVWRVNASLVRIPAHFNLELPRVLGRLIAEHLPTRVAGQWNKHLAAWEEYQKNCARAEREGRRPPRMPEAIWPLQAVFLPYPGKRTYGRGEPILWELKLLGNSADHTFFLEIILPAMEEAGYTKDQRWNQYNSLWGRFDIDSLYVARGDHWEPLAQGGNLDLRYRPTPTQWAEGRSLPAEASAHYSELHWLTPFDFATPAEAFLKQLHCVPTHDDYADSEAEADLDPYTEHYATPFMQILMEALLTRLERIMESQHKGPVNIWNLLEDEQEAHFRAALSQTDKVLLHRHKLERSPRNAPGRLQGSQEFDPIPPVLLPYLDLASILHVGEYTQFGCGSFILI